MKILLVTAEVAPFAKVGGLSQVMYFLPRALRNLGHDVRIFTIKSGEFDKTAPNGKHWKLTSEIEGLPVPIKHSSNLQDSLLCNIKSFRNSKKIPQVYFLENQEYFELRANVFGYKDDHIRFALFSKGCLEWLMYTKKNSSTDFWWPDIIQCNDWHTGYLIDLARRNDRYRRLLAKTPIILTVHNFAFQGNWDFRYTISTDPEEKEPLAPILSEKLQTQNALKRGILLADGINTVSRTHAIEILTPDYAEGLEETLYAVRGKLHGILNGLDTKEFNPTTDTIIKKQFSTHNFLKAREENKKDLLQEFFLPTNKKGPLLAISGRLWKQKGWDLLLDALPHLLSEKPEVQFITIGNGDDRYRNELMNLQKKFPDRIGLHLKTDFRLPRKVFAGADILLIPSLFEPGGIVALEALRYGAVPIVRRTGGLNDIITEFNPNTRKGNGFSFINNDSWALFAAMITAIGIYEHRILWKKLVRNCLDCNFSWEYSAKEYENWYERIIEERKRATRKNPHPAYGLPM